MTKIIRPAGFWYRGDFRLVRVGNYDNSRAKRKWTPEGEDARGVCSWAVPVSLLAAFYKTYSDADLDLVRPCLSARAYAIPWGHLDAYICGQSSRKPTGVEFDPVLHCVSVGAPPFGLGLADDWDDGFGRSETVYFNNPFAVWTSGKAIRRKKRRRPPPFQFDDEGS